MASPVFAWHDNQSLSGPAARSADEGPDWGHINSRVAGKTTGGVADTASWRVCPTFVANRRRLSL